LSYLLDTNTCIALLSSRPAEVRLRFREAVGARAQIFVPTVVVFEMSHGVAKSARPEHNSQRLRDFLIEPVYSLALEQDDAKAAGKVRAEMEAAGRPMGAYDYLIAGQALARNLTLVTSNTREFRRVRGLSLVDWARL
jgi:tRNA(fMet)-specific endonuclease VapC